MPETIDLQQLLAGLSSDCAQTPPDMPIHVATYEATTLVDLVRPHEQRFFALPDFDGPLYRALPSIAGSLDEAERGWRLARAQKQSASLRPVREQAECLRSDTVSAGRYLLRKDQAAQRQLDHIIEGSGIEDLVADLKEIAVFGATHADKLALDPKLPRDLPAEALSLAERLSTVQDGTAALAAQARRNQLYWLLDQAVDEVRAAARYLFRDEPRILAPMLSQYAIKKLRKSRAEKARQSATTAVTPGSNDESSE